MRIGTNILSMNARQSLYENEQRMRDLAIKSANGTNSNKNRDSLNKEFQS